MAKINWSHLPCFLRLGVLRMLSLGRLVVTLIQTVDHIQSQPLGELGLAYSLWAVSVIPVKTGIQKGFMRMLS